MDVIHCKSEVIIKNKKTGKVYKDEDEAKKDIQDSSTDTDESDIQRDVNIIVPELPMDGETN
jgi:hypothetical protein|tara:strand:- start:2639 stop:2824 length:186 start_codon:yes stop_codon:yes gene_type:complete